MTSPSTGSTHPDENRRADIEQLIRANLQQGLFLVDPANPIEFDDNGNPEGIMVTTNEDAIVDEQLWGEHGVYLTIVLVEGVPHAMIGLVDESVAPPPVPLASITPAMIQGIASRRSQALQPVHELIADVQLGREKRRIEDEHLSPDKTRN